MQLGSGRGESGTYGAEDGSRRETVADFWSASANLKSGDVGVLLTEGPSGLLVRPVLEEESPGCLEDEVALYRSEPLELRRYRIEDACVKRRALGDVRRIQLEELVEVAAGDPRDVVAREVAANLCFSPTAVSVSRSRVQYSVQEPT